MEIKKKKLHLYFLMIIFSKSQNNRVYFQTKILKIQKIFNKLKMSKPSIWFYVCF